jgi:hypothetical protein
MLHGFADVPSEVRLFYAIQSRGSSAFVEELQKCY